MSKPKAPIIVSVKAGHESAWISWSDTNDFPVSYYKVICKPDLTVSYTRELSTRMNNLRNGNPYSFQVQAVSIFGESPLSNESKVVYPYQQRKPSPPTIVSTKAGNASAYIEWTASTDERAFPILYYKVVSYPDFQVVYTENLSTHVYSLRNNVDYHFYVYAVNDMGESPVSNESDTVRPFRIARPLPPTQVVVNAGNGSALVSWTASEELEDYPVLYYKVVSWPDFQVVYTENLSTRVFSLRTDIVYHFYVFAVNFWGESRSSKESNAIVPYKISRPDPPIRVGINLNTSNNKVSLTVVWSPPINDGHLPITQYKVLHIQSNTILTTNNTYLTFFENIDTTANYTFVVIATNELGDSKVSEISKPPLAPPNQPVFVIGDRSCALFWNKHELANEYILEINPSFKQITISDHFYTFHDLEPYIQYTVSVRAKKYNQISEPTFVSFTSDSVPQTPTNFRKDKAVNLNLTDVLLSWDPAYASEQYPVLYYTLYVFPENRWDNTNTDGIPTYILESDTNQILLNGLLVTVPYRFVITATNDLGESLFSESIYVNTVYRPDKTVLYKKLVTGGNDPTISRKARYAQYIKSNLRAATINYGGGVYT